MKLIFHFHIYKMISILNKCAFDGITKDQITRNFEVCPSMLISRHNKASFPKFIRGILIYFQTNICFIVYSKLESFFSNSVRQMAERSAMDAMHITINFNLNDENTII